MYHLSLVYIWLVYLLSVLLTLLSPYVLSLVTSTKLIFFQSIVLQSLSFNWQDSNVFCLMAFLGFLKNLFISSLFPLFSCFLYFSISFVLGSRGMCSFCLWHSCLFSHIFYKATIPHLFCNSNLEILPY